MCVAPGQIGGKTDTGEEIQHQRGPADVARTTAEHRRHPGTDSPGTAARRGRAHPAHRHLADRAGAGVRQPLLRPAARTCSLAQQELSSSAKAANSDQLTRFENLLQHYYDDGTQRTLGLPTVKYCAQELFLSPNYFGDLIRELTGKSATSHIRRFIMQRSQTLLLQGETISETAESLGFEYPQHFTRQFKKYFGMTPTEFLHK